MLDFFNWLFVDSMPALVAWYQAGGHMINNAAVEAYLVDKASA